MTDARPNPDDLLARVQKDEERTRRGRLKIFFGYAAGVGKTFAMLEAARKVKAAGEEVVVGYVEPHGRQETERLLDGLEAIPQKMVPYRGVLLREFDLDAALARKPRLLLVDELAHSNAEGCRHAKRWQDVEELLQSGIDVYTTLNVQHLESLNDVIAQITGVVVRETLPDTVLERADELELIDLTPQELEERLGAGKIYLVPQAQRALGHFFQKGKLVALRELSMRQAANRVRRDVEEARRTQASPSPWATSERLLVCISPSPTTPRLIRTTKRMADAMGADWLAVSVHGSRPLSPESQDRIAQHFHLAEQLGAETHTLAGEKVADTILDYARSRNVTKIIVGKTAQPSWRRLLFGTVADTLLDHSGDIDVYVVRGEPEGGPAKPRAAAPRPTKFDGRPYLATTAIVIGCTLLAALLDWIGMAEGNLVMVFLLGVVYAATRFGRGPAVAASVAGVFVFDFFFIPPYFSFSVNDAQYLLTFAIMLGIGVLISTLAARLRDQLAASQQQERRTAALYRLTKQLGEVEGSDFLLLSAGQQLRELFGGEVVLYVAPTGESPTLRFGEESGMAKVPVNALVAQWVAEHERPAGLGTDTLPSATGLFVPLVGSQRTLGVLGVRPEPLERLNDPEQRRLLESCASLIALSLQRDQSLLDAHEAKIQVRTEQLRSSLLSSVSHDLRTPLAAIAGSGSRLLDHDFSAEPADQRELVQTIVDEAKRLRRLVDNLLDMTRLESGAISLNRQWHVVEELVGSARNRLSRELAGHTVRVAIPEDFPLLNVDGILLEQVFENLLENAARYTPVGSRIDIAARAATDRVEITLSDDGPGLAPGSESRIFDKFYRGSKQPADGRRGVGLGLAICQAVLQAHGGTIRAANRPEGGARFTLSLPREAAPEIPPEVVQP